MQDDEPIPTYEASIISPKNDKPYYTSKEMEEVWQHAQNSQPEAAEPEERIAAPSKAKFVCLISEYA